MSLDEVDYDDRTICEICDPGEDRPPPLVNYHPLVNGEEGEPVLDVGTCDWCNGTSVRCRGCGEVVAVMEGEYGKTIDCPGGCGIRFVVKNDFDPRDGGGGTYVELVDKE